MNQYLDPYDVADLEGWKKWYNTIAPDDWPTVPLTVNEFLALPDFILHEIAIRDNMGWWRAKLFTANRVPINQIPSEKTCVYSDQIDPKIFLAGASWAKGEFDNGKLVHKGVEQYFIDYGYTVNNVAGPGISNRNSILILKHSLAQQYNPNDIIFWIYGTPIRDFAPSYSMLHNALKESGGVHNLIKKMGITNLSWLNEIAEEFNTSIYVIGCCGIPDEIQNYKNLIPIVRSWPGLAIGDPDVRIEVMDNWYKEEIVQWSKYPKKFAVQVVDEVHDIVAKADTVFKEKVFHPDGVHPNRHGHKILFDYLIKELKL
jgi:hypothetical protein